ncbi:helix-turn-helix domain-containing protein [Rhodopirellula sp. MGV]|uniref:helix-turn-helix domain-containing protein n=1 Tax=Rhodopirellula sp. MGV TaxID=2023130 RepID=UPI000B97BE31|nr:helix-turn-helix domain-containing protein [Rhodopirellula sp. MGV]OYP38906.1 hypothetical protein CGZ80_01415 [Rhodopirellula sp. MGV]PNY38280.1 DNA-binding protein [Rhodopirellula baltica]
MIQTFNTSEAAEVLKCSPDQVRALIIAGKLHATNTSLGSQRARWVITQQAIEEFLSPPKVQETKRRKLPATSGKHY